MAKLLLSWFRRLACKEQVGAPVGSHTTYTNSKKNQLKCREMKKTTLVIAVSVILFSGLYSYGQDIATLYREVNPSVVTIMTVSKNVDSNYQVVADSGLGSGVLISDSGVILTAAHVVNNAEKIEVKFLNGEVIPAKVIRSAPIADIAAIKVSWMPKKYTVSTLGDSNKVSIGEKVIVVGAPFGLDHSLSVGYISRRSQEKNRSSSFIQNEFFQTDASINQGNSGGPMFNLKGEIIGISSYIITKSGGFDGLGFAVTSNLAKELVVSGNRRWTGVEGYILDEATAWILNVPMNGGMLVESVVRYSPADFAGIKGGFQKVVINEEEITLGGDVILSVNGIPISRKIEDLDFLDSKTYNIKILRAGRIEEIVIRFKEE
jgi:serine protease Do